MKRPVSMAAASAANLLSMLPATMRAAEIYGRLESRKNGEPVAGVVVTAYYSSGGRTTMVVTDAEGKYHLVGLPTQTEIALGYTGHPKFHKWGILHLVCPNEGTRMELNAMLYPSSGRQPAEPVLQELKLMRD